MIRIFSLKQQGKEGVGQASAKKSSAAQLRVQKGTPHRDCHSKVTILYTC